MENSKCLVSRSLRSRLEEDRVFFKDFILKPIQLKFTIVHIDEWSLNPSTLPLYTLMKKGRPTAKVIRIVTERYNSITAQWNNNLYLMIKRSIYWGKCAVIY